MKPLSRIAGAGILPVLLLVIGMLACKGKNSNTTVTTGDQPDAAVNPLFEQSPPAVGDISIRELKDNPDGNVLFVADFSESLRGQKFHAVMLGEEKIVLRDDGKNGDEKEGDGKFSVVLKDDIAAIKESWKVSVAALQREKEIVSFNGRTMLRTPIEAVITAAEPFANAEAFTIPRFPIKCGPPVTVKKDHSLMITDKAVVEDKERTFNPCSQEGNPNGAWAFPKLITEMTGSSGVTPEDFLLNWLKSWTVDQTVNADLIAKRTAINTLINNWQTVSGGTFNIKFAPFKLIAIVNRIDLRGSVGYGITNPGEGRLVFTAIQCSGKELSIFGSAGKPFQVIFEYGLPHKKCEALLAFANEWAALSGMVLGSSTYNTALEKITNQFTLKNTSPSKPNGSSLNQIRTNEIVLAGPWELREFNIDSATHHLKNVTVKQEPQVRFNKQHPSQVPADVATMVKFINTHTPAVEANTYKVEEIEGGKNFLAGKAHTLNPVTYHWNGATVAGPEFITSDSARFVFSLNTCSGCHGGEANTGNFMHVGPGGSTGVPAVLSKFLTGNPAMSSFPFIVTDRALRPVAPGKARGFNDLERRKLDLEKFVTCPPCNSRVKSFALAETLREKPINMTH
jgi:hypothetical protein